MQGNADQQHEREREDEVRGHSDAQRVGQTEEQPREDGEDQDDDPDQQPQRRVLLAQLASEQERDDEGQDEESQADTRDDDHALASSDRRLPRMSASDSANTDRSRQT